MKTNITALMNLIAEDEKTFNNLLYSIKGYVTNTTIEELDGKTNIIEDNKEEFETELKELESLTTKISKNKAILYEKNNSFCLKDGRTIQQAIVDNTNLRKLKVCYESLLSYKNSKKRVSEVNNSYFECNTINFDYQDIKNKLKNIDSIIQNTDFEISKLNSIEFEI